MRAADGQKVLKHVKCMDGDRLIKKVYGLYVHGGSDKRRPCTRWLDGVTKACIARSLELWDVTMSHGRIWRMIL